MRRLSIRGFSLLELLVVVSIIAILIAILLPSLAASRRKAKTLACLSNMRGMEIAHTMYLNDYNGYLIEAGLGHGGEHVDEPVAWINTLQLYYNNKLLARCAADQSIYWPPTQGGSGLYVPDSNPLSYRRTSYGINDFVAPELDTDLTNFTKITQIDGPGRIVHFLEMTETGDFAGSDHPHVETWFGTNIPAIASQQVQIDRHGGPLRDFNSLTNYGFLDGHAETLHFKDVYLSITRNKFNPLVTY